MVYLLSKNKISIPIIGLGTRGKTTPAIICKAIEVGYRHIDTAAMYENEKEIGQGILDSTIKRKEIFLTTKINTFVVKNKNINSAFHNSLLDLKTDYVDLLLIHWPIFSTNLGDMLEILYSFKDSKKVKAIGVSNFSSNLLNECINLGFTDIFCNQVEYHPFLSQAILIETMQKLNIMAVAYCPLCKGEVAKNKTLIELANKYNKTTGQITLRWLVQQKWVAIPKTENLIRLKENINVFDFKLDDKDMEKVFNLARGYRQVPNYSSYQWD